MLKVVIGVVGGLVIAFLVLVLIVSAAFSTGGPESLAKKTMDNYLEMVSTTQGGAYRNLSVETVKNDGTFATVRAKYETKANAKAEWKQETRELDCKKLPSSWECTDPLFTGFQRLLGK